jgi:hypothetical protein
MRYRLVGRSGLRVSELLPMAQALDLASRVPLGFPGDFGGASLAYGNTFELIDDHRGRIDPLV